MDVLDREIIGVLQHDGRISVTDLADRIDLSVSATSERLRRLQSNGVISGFTVLVDPVATGRSIEALIEVRLAPGTATADVDAAVVKFPAVLNAYHLTGRFDTQLHVAARDVAELDQLLETLKDEVGAEETNTRLILRTIDGFPRPAAIAL